MPLIVYQRQPGGCLIPPRLGAAAPGAVAATLNTEDHAEHEGREYSGDAEAVEPHVE